MLRIRTFGILILFISILIAAVFLPSNISQTRDNRLLGKVKIQPVDKRISVNTANISVVDKIALISGYNRIDKNIVMVNQNQQLGGKLTEEDAPVIVLNQLEKLKESGIFPKIELNNQLDCRYALKNYTDMNKPDNNVRVWDVQFYSDKIVLNALMDVDTHLIYELYIWSGDLMAPVDFETLPEKFANYIGVEWDDVRDKKLQKGKYSVAGGKIYYLFNEFVEGNGQRGVRIAISSNEKIYE